MHEYCECRGADLGPNLDVTSADRKGAPDMHLAIAIYRIMKITCTI
jgi:hypothetical protein